MHNLHSLLKSHSLHLDPINGQHTIPNAQLAQSGRWSPLHDGCYGEEAAAIPSPYHHVQAKPEPYAVSVQGHLHGVWVVGEVVGACGGYEGY